MVWMIWLFSFVCILWSRQARCIKHKAMGQMGRSACPAKKIMKNIGARPQNTEHFYHGKHTEMIGIPLHIFVPQSVMAEMDFFHISFLVTRIPRTHCQHKSQIHLARDSPLLHQQMIVVYGNSGRTCPHNPIYVYLYIYTHKATSTSKWYP